MSTEHAITRKASDGTLDIGELREFLDEFEKAAASAGPPSHTGRIKPKVRIAFGGGIKSITVTVPGGEKQ